MSHAATASPGRPLSRGHTAAALLRLEPAAVILDFDESVARLGASSWLCFTAQSLPAVDHDSRPSMQASRQPAAERFLDFESLTLWLDVRRRLLLLHSLSLRVLLLLLLLLLLRQRRRAGSLHSLSLCSLLSLSLSLSATLCPLSRSASTLHSPSLSPSTHTHTHTLAGRAAKVKRTNEGMNQRDTNANESISRRLCPPHRPLIIPCQKRLASLCMHAHHLQDQDTFSLANFSTLTP